ncbi:MAG TPA: glucosaminidase domain-containing protein [Burkholderiales bacterium]|nr:glucosaminidase domain-containing protein [Burkholderiales bacterium]
MDAAPQHRGVTALLAAALLVPCLATAAPWSCHGVKPGHPTPEERAAFVREVSELAVKAEKTHGVPASALAAIAIAESGYGYTRIAIHANNLFAWKFVPAAANSLKQYVLECRRSKSRFAHFDSKAHAFDFVAAKLATLEAYREHTEAYQAARKRGVAAEAAVKAWIAGVAKSYSRKPEVFVRKLVRIMNDPVDPRDTLSHESNLYRLSAALRGAH